MLCQICNEREPTLKLVKLLPNQPMESFEVCEECAVKVSPFRRKIRNQKDKNDLKIQKLLQHLVAGEQKLKEGTEGEDEPVCGECGLSFSTYRATYMLGCPACYDAFGEHLLTDIRKIHGATAHKGPPPAAAQHPAEPKGGHAASPEVPESGPAEPPPPAAAIDKEAQLRALRRKLDEAVAAEDFESAAELRDRIRSLEEEN